MWKAYIKVVKKKVPQAVHILDRFHIVANLNKALNEVRAEEAKSLKQKGYEAVLKGSQSLRKSKKVDIRLFSW